MIRQAFKSLLKNKIINLLLIVQLTVVFQSLFGFINSIEKANVYNRKANEILDLKSSISLQERKISFIDQIKANKDNYRQFLNYLDNNDKIQYGTYVSTGILMNLNENINEEKKRIIKDNIDRYVGNDRVPVVQSMIIDYKFSKLMKFPIREGRFFEEGDFGKGEGQTVPIILGNGYKEIFKVGDEFKGKVGDKSYKIIGFLKKDFVFFGLGTSIINNMDNYEWGAIIPITEKDELSETTLYQRTQKGCIYQVKKGIDSNNAISDINNKAELLKINAESKYLSDLIHEKMKKSSSSIFYLLVEGITLGIFSIGTFIIIVLTFISRRKREFGIRIATGASIFDIMKLISTEIITTMAIAYLINWGKYFYFYRNYVTGENIHKLGRRTSMYNSCIINFNMLIGSFGVFILIFLLVAIIPMIRIKNTEPKDLIGGIE